MNNRGTQPDTDSPTARRPWRNKTRQLAMGGTLLVAGLVAAACGSSSTTSTAASPTTGAPSAATTAPASTGASTSSSTSMGTVHVAMVGSLGSVLVNAQGRTLYLYTPDKQSKVTCSGACAKAWPPLDATKPVAGTGAKASLLGTDMAAGGKDVVTYNKWPLYTFSGDSAAGQAHGEGLEGVWYAVSASGAEVKAGGSASAKSTPAATTAPTTAASSGAVGY